MDEVEASVSCGGLLGCQDPVVRGLRHYKQASGLYVNPDLEGWELC